MSVNAVDLGYSFIITWGLDFISSSSLDSIVHTNKSKTNTSRSGLTESFAPIFVVERHSNFILFPVFKHSCEEIHSYWNTLFGFSNAFS